MTPPGQPGVPTEHPFDQLTPQAVLDALALAGLYGDGRLLQLNSYENRVFQVMLEDGGAVVGKFYRPGRWRDEQIQEEHDFARQLAAADLPVVAPLPLQPDGRSLLDVPAGEQVFRLAVYPRCAGQGPDLEQPDTLRWLGRLLGRLHAVGAQQPFVHRRSLNPVTFGHAARQRLLDMDLLPPAQGSAWAESSAHALGAIDAAFAACPAGQLRLHGDCHPGNILWRRPDAGGAGPHIVDLDDAVMGPAVQDLWMLLSGDHAAMRSQLQPLLAGYRQFSRFDLRELALIKPLRTLRMLHHSVWLAERWADPAFPAAFPWFGSPAYWGQQTMELREQIEAMAQPPLDGDWLD